MHNEIAKTCTVNKSKKPQTHWNINENKGKTKKFFSNWQNIKQSFINIDI